MDAWNAVRACLTCFKAPSIDVNGRSLEIERLLGEGGFAYVYLVRDTANGKQYALKKIRCPFGGESVANAMREVEACNKFKNAKQIIHSVGSSVRQEADGTKTVLLLLPYYSKGNLSNLVYQAMLKNEPLPESRIVQLAKAITEALKAMHKHREASSVSASTSGEDSRASPDAENQGLLAGSDNVDGSSVELGEVLPYAHRDIKPENIMFDDDGNIILMDLGSCSPARVHVTTRQQALELQDMAAEHCTLPYRAPELFDVRTGTQIDERVDVWSLGCTIYTLMYFVSPFEREEQVQGANVQYAASTGKYSFPATPEYSQGLKDVVAKCLTVKASDRPDIIAVESMLSGL